MQLLLLENKMTEASSPRPSTNTRNSSLWMGDVGIVCVDIDVLVVVLVLN